MKRAAPAKKETQKTDPRGARDVDAYLAALPSDSGAALQKLRDAIRNIAPAAEEGFSYGLPAFRLGGRPLVCYGASKHHCSFYPMSPAVMRELASSLAAYDISKGTIRFAPEKPLLVALIRKLVKARIAELKEANA